MRLEGARVVLTGVSRGVGLEILRLLLSKGSLVAACARNKGDLTDADRGRFQFHMLDVSDPVQANRLINSATNAFEGLDVLINNASVTHDLKMIEEITSEDVLNCYQNNVFSIFNTLRYSLPIMKSQRNGLIINFSSRCGRRAIPRLAAYCSTKFAVRGITEAVAKETEGTELRCISISPAGINTQMRRGLFGEEEARQQQTPERIADIVCKIIRGEIKVPNGSDVVIFKDVEPIIKVPEQ